MAPILVPQADMGAITQPFIETNTRTVFTDVLCYAEESGTILEYIESPESRNTVVALREGHFPLNSYAPTDPRVQHLRPNPELGPGTFNLDSLYIPYHNDSSRSSPIFKSPPRAQRSLDAQGSSSAAEPLPLDFDSWTAKGFYIPHSPARSPQRAKDTTPDVVYENACNLTTDGRPASCAAASALSPGSQSSFQSVLPRLYAPTATTSAAIAPGCYSLEQPRFRSMNQAYASAAPMESLASLSSDNSSNERRFSRPLSPVKLPPPVRGKFSPPNSRSNSPQRVISPQRVKVGALSVEGVSHVDEDWQHHEALTRAHFMTGVSADDQDLEDQDLSHRSTQSTGIIDDARVGECAAQMRAQLSYTAQYVAAAAQMRQQRFGSLVFSKRDTPHQVLIKSKIQAKEDVKRARQAVLQGQV